MMRANSLSRSSALVSAGLLVSGGAVAQELHVGGIKVMLGGSTEFGAVTGSKNTITAEHDRNYTFFMDNGAFFLANGATESGIRYGSEIELKVGTGGLDGSSPDIFLDKAGLFLSGNFGRFELGRDDGAEDVMYLGGEDAQAGTGGIDSHLFVVSGDLGLLPGITLLTDLAYNTNHLEATGNGITERDDTVSGVASIQLDY